MLSSPKNAKKTWRALPCPDFGLKCSGFLFSGLVTALMCAFVFSSVAWRDAPKALDTASTVHGEPLISFRFVGTP